MERVLVRDLVLTVADEHQLPSNGTGLIELHTGELAIYKNGVGCDEEDWRHLMIVAREQLQEPEGIDLRALQEFTDYLNGEVEALTGKEILEVRRQEEKAARNEMASAEKAELLSKYRRVSFISRSRGRSNGKGRARNAIPRPRKPREVTLVGFRGREKAEYDGNGKRVYRRKKHIAVNEDEGRGLDCFIDEATSGTVYISSSSTAEREFFKRVTRS